MDVPFQKFVIKGKAFTQIFFEHLSDPDTELHAALGFDAIAHRDDHVEAEILNRFI